MNVEIRQLRPGEEAVLARVAPDVFDQQIDPQRAAAYLAEPSHFMFVAIVDGVVVGQCAAVVHRHPDKPNELYIDEVGVTPTLHRRGIATRMLDAMLEFAQSIGCEEAWVGTEIDNRPARGLYRRFQPKTEGTFVMFEYEF